MVGMDVQLMHENSDERDCINEEESLKPCVEAKENMTFHSKDSCSPTTAAGEQGIIKESALCPITPILSRENGDSVIVKSTPLSVESPPSPNVGVVNPARNEVVVTSDLDGSPHTPDEGVFDPFAPGPDEMLLAPCCKKYVKMSQKVVARRLDFDDVDDFPAFRGDNKNEDTLLEKALLDSVYGTLLEAIILKQSEEFLAENGPLKSEGLDTPPSPPPLMGTAETCPGAPVKAAAGRSRNIDPGLCKKLEF